MWRLHYIYYFNTCPKQGIMDRPTIFPYNQQTNLIFVLYKWSLPINNDSVFALTGPQPSRPCLVKSENCEKQGPSRLVNKYNIHKSCCLWHLGMHMVFCILFLQFVDPRATVNSWCTTSTLHMDAHTRHQFLLWYNKIGCVPKEIILQSLWQIYDESLSYTLFCLTAILKQ